MSFVEERLPSKEIILLTGSTGALGTSILAQLVELSSVGRIYALNRTDARNGISLEIRQASALRQRGYDEAILQSDKVVLVEGDTTLPQLGISYELFDEASLMSLLDDSILISYPDEIIYHYYNS